MPPAYDKLDCSTGCNIRVFAVYNIRSVTGASQYRRIKSLRKLCFYWFPTLTARLFLSIGSPR